MSVSVVIPTFNRVPVLSRALDSVYAQTLAPTEIIVVDDGSRDDTAHFIRRFYPDVRYVRQSHTGVSGARNRGIREADGEWIAFLDSDDAWDPSKLRRQMESIEREAQRYLLCHTDEIWIRDGRRVNPKKKHRKSGGWIFEQCLALCAISPSSAIVHRRVFADVGVFDESLPACEDYDLWLRICARYPVLLVNQPLVIKYGGHSDQLSRRYWAMDRFRVQALEKLLRQCDLPPECRAPVLRILITKLEILLNGARKRGNVGLREQYEGRYLLYRDQMAAVGGQRTATSLMP